MEGENNDVEQQEYAEQQDMGDEGQDNYGQEVQEMDQEGDAG